MKSSKIKIIECYAVGDAFANMTPNSIHEVLPTPKDDENEDLGVWVMGVGEPVKLLAREFIRLRDDI